MSKQIKMSSPLSEVDFSKLANDSSVLSIQEDEFLGYINIRGSNNDKSFIKAVESTLAADLPIAPNTFSSTEHGDLLWLGPNEWLLVCGEGKETDLIEKLKTKLGDTFSAVTDVSGGNTLLNISGSKARALLEKGCPIDLHPSQFKQGQCAQSLIAKTGVTFYQVDDSPSYKVVVRRSFADYLGNYLLDATKEFCR